MDGQKVRERLDRELGNEPVNEREWAYLQEREYGVGVEKCEYTISELAEVVRELRQAFREHESPRETAPQVRPAPKKVQDIEAEDREQAISWMLYMDAIQQHDVLEFRERELNGKLLEPDEVEAWASRQDDSPTVWLADIPVPEPHEVTKVAADTYQVEPPLTVSTVSRPVEKRLPLFVDAAGDRRTEVKITAGGVLERLARLCERLQRRYGWHMVQAVSFVLTNAWPIVNSTTVALTRDSPFSALVRIKLSIDPALSPLQVANDYRHVRNLVIGEGTRSRELTRKHKILAMWHESQSGEMTWVEKKRLWNEGYPQWGYDNEAIFARDCRRAVQRLLRPKYQITAQGG